MPSRLPRADRSPARARGARAPGGGPGRLAGRRAPAVALLAFLPLLALLACSYSSTPSRLPGHIRTVAIPVFENQTPEPGLDQEVTDLVTREFVSDNSLRVVPEGQADSGIYGRIVRYENQVFGYNAQAQTEEYEVRIEVQIEFKDLVKRKTLWKEDSIVGRTTYFVVDTTGQEARDEVSGRAQAIQRLAEDILNRTVRSWS